MTLVDVRSLAARLSSGITVIDVRWRLGGPPGREGYLRGHIPGAVFLDLDRQVCGPSGPGGRHPLPEPEALQEALRAAGVRTGVPVVVYDAGDGVGASRLWWTLRWAGHPHVSVLDGGLAAWIESGLPLETGEAVAAPGDVTVRPGNMPLLDAEGAAQLAQRGVLIDARIEPRYRGEVEPVDPVAGHIPGAVNLPSMLLVDASGRLRSVDELRAAIEGVIVRARAARVSAPVVGAGVGGAADLISTSATASASAMAATASASAMAATDGAPMPIGAYCGSGVTAAQTILALFVAGYREAALYVGSWSEWCGDPSRPVAREGMA